MSSIATKPVKNVSGCRCTSERVEVRVRLAEEMCNAGILDRIDELHVRLFIIRFQCLETFFGYTFYTLLLLFFRVRVDIDYSPSEVHDAVLSLSPDVDQVPPMQAIGVLVLGAPLTVPSTVSSRVCCGAWVSGLGEQETTYKEDSL